MSAKSTALAITDHPYFKLLTNGLLPAIAIIYGLWWSNIDNRFKVLEAHAGNVDEYIADTRERDNRRDADIAVMKDAFINGKADRLRWQQEAMAKFNSIEDKLYTIIQGKH